MALDLSQVVQIGSALLSVLAAYVKLREQLVKLQTRQEISEKHLDDAIKRLDKATDQLNAMWSIIPGAYERTSDKMRRELNV
jgi:biopolymer transport protein ExbB/TolQ